VYGEPVSITANVTSPYGGSPTGTSTFFEGDTVLGTFSLPYETSYVTLTTSRLPVGINSIMASYSGDTHFDASSGVASITNVPTTSSASSASAAPRGRCPIGRWDPGR
jgi:Bacterial Ig-like domain (group 3)